MDVFTTHLSLSHHAREVAALEIQKWTSQQHASPYQFLLGDFNAEPQERSYRFLVGDAEAALDGRVGNWTDAWTAGPNEGSAGLTFPAWGPSKRIDFILYRARDPGPPAPQECPAEDEVACASSSSSPPSPPPPSASSSGSLRATAVELVGTEPTEDTRHLGISTMLEPGAAILPSDHLGVWARFEIVE